jgi:hypothetical protein
MVYGWRMWFRFALVMILLRPDGAPGAEARLRDGERVRGEMVSLGEAGLVIHPRWSRDPLRLESDRLAWLAPGGNRPDRGEISENEVRFWNGDRIAAENLSLADDLLVLRTSWGQTVRIRKEAVSEIHFSDPGERVRMQGPGGGMVWQFQDPRGTGLAPGAAGEPFVFFAASGITARTELPALPPRFAFEVDVRPRDVPYSYRMNLFGQGNNTRGPGNINVQVTQNVLSISGEARDRAESVTWRDRLPDGARSEHRFVFWVDLVAETVEVDLNEECLLTLKLPEAASLTGAEDRSFSFQPQAGNGRIELMGLRLRERSAVSPPLQAGRAGAGRDRVYLRGGRRLEGRVFLLSSRNLRVREGRDIQVVSRDQVLLVRFAANRDRGEGLAENCFRMRTGDYRGRVSLLPSGDDLDAVRGSVRGWLDPVVIPFRDIHRMEAADKTFTLPARGRDAVHLLNGDVVFGDLLPMRGTDLVLRYGDGEEFLRIPAAYVGQVRRRNEPFQMDRSADVLLEYVNGDRLSGRFVRMDEDEVVVETAWGQEIRSRRPYVRSLHWQPSGRELIWRGPGRLEDWHVTVSGPVVDEPEQAGGTLVLPGIRGMTRGMPPMPDRFEILIRMHTAGGQGDFTVEFFKQGTPDAPVGGLHIFTQGITLQGRGIFGGRNDLYFQQNVRPALMSSDRDLRILADLRERRMVVVFNGDVIGPWLIPEAEDLRKQPERMMRILARSPFQALRVEEIRFAAYPHAFPGAADADMNLPGDRVRFSNGDVLRARLIDGEGMHYRLEIRGEPLEVPRSRIESARFNTDPLIFPRRRARDTRFYAAGSRDRLTGALTGFDGEIFTVEGDLWLENLQLPRSSFTVADFNIHAPVRFDDRIERVRD